MSAPIIRCDSLSRTFQTKTGPIRAVADLDLEVDQGEILGLLGPNGAGKTTTVRLLTGLLRPSGGQAWVDGYSVADDPDQVRRRIGLVPGEGGHHLQLTVHEELAYFGAFYGLDEAEVRARAAPLIDRLELGHRQDDRLHTFSKGMRRKVQLIRALLHQPRVLLLDEPTAGLDPAISEEVWDLLRDLTADRQVTIILCSHHLEEVERLCQRIAVIRGRLLAQGTVAQLSGGEGHRIELVNEAAPFASVAAAVKGVEAVESNGKVLQLRLEGTRESVIPEVMRALVEAGAGVVASQSERRGLRSLYRQIVEGRDP